MPISSGSSGLLLFDDGNGNLDVSVFLTGDVLNIVRTGVE
jgi:hypothetical protein